MQLDSLFTYDSVALNAAGDGVVIVDQTLLPGERSMRLSSNCVSGELRPLA